ncbi:hypothetical protein PVAND_014871 [Polypedilum vanderplanki]|uniref:Reverse transcriptase domain-containing protein n=1 Tax=Polypedilum vanderplanki TaxID=319348 RepID=A0A9J6BB05_POLVA|nr:hypothetical protein PVAND_014871 [Polypedilum vanderplanki]
MKQKSLLDIMHGTNYTPINKIKNKQKHATSSFKKNLMNDYIQRTPRITSNLSNSSTQSTEKSLIDADDTIISIDENYAMEPRVLGELDKLQVELPHMLSREERGRILNDKVAEIDNWDGNVETQKKIFRSLYTDLEFFIVQNEKLTEVINVIINDRPKINEVIKSTNSITQSVDNFNKRVCRIDKEVSDMNDRLETVETVTESIYNSSRLGIIFLDKTEGNDVEAGKIKPHIKIQEIFKYMSINYAKSSIANTFLMTSRRMIRNESQLVKILEIRFNDTVTAGRIFAQMSKWNNEACKNGDNKVRYFAERPLGPNMLNLLKKCKKLAEERKIKQATPTERGIRVKYEVLEAGRNKDKVVFIACEKDLEQFHTVTSPIFKTTQNDDDSNDISEIMNKSVLNKRNLSIIKFKEELDRIQNNLNLSILCWNVRSIKNIFKFKRVKTFISGLVNHKENQNSVDCFIFIESWIKRNDDFRFYEFKNYISVINGRNDDTNGGGIVIYIKKNYSFREIFSITNKNFEATLIEIYNSNIKNSILAIYRPPSGSLSLFLIWLESILVTYDDLIIIGDINVNTFEPNNSYKYTDLLHCNNYFISNTFATRLASNTLLDHIILNSENRNWKEAKLFTSSLTSLSDHCILMTLLCGKNNVIKRIKTKVIRNNYNAIGDDLTAIKNDLYRDVINNEISFDGYIKTTQNIVNKHKTILNIKHRINDNIPPYVDAKMIKMMRNIDNLNDKIIKRKRFKLPTNRLLNKMMNIKSKLADYEKEKARKHYTFKINRDRNATWKIINEMCGRSNKCEKIVLRTEAGLVSDDKVTANLFNQHFTKSDNCDIQYIHLGRTVNFNMHIAEIDEERVNVLLKNLAINKSTGSDEIPVRVWRELEEHSSIITILINRVLNDGIYPLSLKVAKVIPVFKGGDSTLLKNYRPISILPAINKILEKVIYDQMIDHMNKYELFPPLQYGFREGRSTNDAVNKVLSFISDARDKKQSVVVLSIDVKKAFDSIKHNILLSKMEKIGFRGKIYDLIKNYLSDRKQFVKVGDYESDLLTIDVGVPQGSNLGPLLFVIMLSDVQYLNLSALIVEFADDIILLWTCTSNESMDKIENDLQLINRYYINNGLDINSEKSKYMVVGNVSIQGFEDMFGRYGYEKVKELKYLGTIIDDIFSMKPQQQKIVAKLTNALRAIKIIRNFLPVSAVWQFYNAFISSHINYCSFMLIRLPVKMIKRMQSIQSRGIKIIHRLDPQFPTIELFKKYAKSTLPVIGSIYMSILTLLRKALNTPSETFGNFEVKSEGRRKNQICIKRFRTNYVRKDVTYIGPKLFNQLPEDIRCTTDLKSFKRKVRNFLIENIGILLDVKNLQTNRIV